MPTQKNVILNGDCAEALKTLDDCSIDAVVSDPPYGLGTREPTGPEIDQYLAGANLDTGGDFMGKEWEIPPVRVWLECLRVLKPGGILMAFAGTRTWDIMWAGINAAGFAEHEGLKAKFGQSMLQWIHGQGFPKSLNISAAIDKMFRGINVPAGKLSLLQERLGGAFDERVREDSFDDSLADHLSAVSSGFDTFTDESWVKVKAAFGVSDEEEMEFEKTLLARNKGAKGKQAPSTPAEETEEEDASDEAPKAAAPTKTLLAKKWAGWGTALKPSWEPVLVFYKPGAEPRPIHEMLDASFFYTAKVSKSEATLNGQITNSHPTRKPLALMRWCCRLAADKGALVLDPYCGSGTTCVAAIEEHQDYIGIERDLNFHDTSTKRTAIVRSKVGEERDQKDLFSMMLDDLPQE